MKNLFFFSFSEEMLKIGSSAAGANLISLGSCFGKFTKSGKFHLHITALDYLAPYAKVSFTALALAILMCEGKSVLFYNNVYFLPLTH